jgi:hypothetical protein
MDISITQATAIPGTATILVTASDMTTQTVTIEFDYLLESSIKVELVRLYDMNNEDVIELSPSDNITCTIKFTNRTQDIISTVVTAALFSQDGSMLQSTAIYKSMESLGTDSFDWEMTLPQDVQGTYIKIFARDIKSGMQPISNIVLFPSN